jgi:hypothetical protein
VIVKNFAFEFTFHNKVLYIVGLGRYHDPMRERKQEGNSLSGYVTVLLSLIALLAVVAGYGEPPHSDEGIAAHIFQFAIVSLVPTVLAFVATGDWSQPLRTARPLMFSAAALAFAFGALYYLEHYRNPMTDAGQWNRLPLERALTRQLSPSRERHGFQGCVPPRHPKQTDGVIEIRFLFRDRWDDHRGARSTVIRIRLGGFLERFVVWLYSQGNFLTAERASCSDLWSIWRSVPDAKYLYLVFDDFVNGNVTR